MLAKKVSLKMKTQIVQLVKQDVRFVKIMLIDVLNV